MKIALQRLMAGALTREDVFELAVPGMTPERIDDDFRLFLAAYERTFKPSDK
jgi:hypothetical protein